MDCRVKPGNDGVDRSTSDAVYDASTARFAPSALAILTRLPAGQSRPVTRQTVSSIRIVPTPLTIGWSSVNSRPT
jgi:hypothetical protein